MEFKLAIGLAPIVNTSLIIQVDINPDRIGLTKKVNVGISGDAKLIAEQIFEKLSSNAGDTDRQVRKDLIHQTKSAWLQKLSSLDHEDDDEGTVWNQEARKRDAMKKPVKVAGINKLDMKKQPSLNS